MKAKKIKTEKITNLPEKFNQLIEKIEKLEKCVIIKKEEKAAIIAREINITQLIVRGENLFGGQHRQEKPRKFLIFFLATFDDKEFLKDKLVKEFIKKDLPILYFAPFEYSIDEESLKLKLRKFIAKVFIK